MSYPATTVRLVTVVAERSSRSARWGTCPQAAPDPHGNATEHWAHYLGPRRPQGSLGRPRIRDGWQGACETCGTPIPWRDAREPVYGSAGHQLVYDTDSGRLEPGCMSWADDYEGRCFHWDNCPGRHLHVILPNGITWDIDSRAANCTLRDNRTHRCWVRTGEPPNITAGKGGPTCSAGAGSIAAGDYHGFLHQGVLTAG